MTLSLGALIGHYTVIEQVGADGTTAEVYRGRDERNHRVVALKLLAGTSALSQREARAVATLSHPNIVATLDVIEHNGRLCLVQEWIEGGSLAADLDRIGRLSVQETVRLGRDVASALAYAHQHNILHRDITPSNVLRTVGGTYKLTDFGAFGQLQSDTRLTTTGQIAGTPLYMSPEQITGAAQSPASDLFGLGLLLYRCLHGRLPDDGAASYVQLAATRLLNPISVPPSPLQGLLERCLALDPGQRPQSAAEVLTALNQLATPDPPEWASHPRVSYRSEEGAPRPAATVSPPPRPDAERTGPAARKRSRGIPGRLLLAVAALIAVLGAAVVVTITLDSADPRPPSAGRPSSARPTTGMPVPSTPTIPGQPTEPGSAGGPGPASSSAPGPPPSGNLDPAPMLNIVSVLVRIGTGFAIATVALFLALRIRRRWASRAPEAERRAARVLFGADQRGELTRSLMIEVDQVVRNLNSLDAKFLGMTVLAMIREYEDAKESSERQTALLNVVVLMEKLQARFSPWHVRHKDAIATGVAVVGALAGVASVVSGFLG